MAAEQGQQAREGALGGTEAHRRENEGRERGLGVNQFLEGGAEERAGSGHADISVHNGWVDVVVVAVGSAVQNQLQHDLCVAGLASFAEGRLDSRRKKGEESGQRRDYKKISGQEERKKRKYDDN